MRVLVTAVPQGGHVYPLLPLTNAFVEQGDEVVFATGPDGLHLVEGPGTRVVPVGTGFGAWWQSLASRTRGAPGDGLPPDRVLPYFLPRLFAEAGTIDMVDDLLALARDFEPDLIVHDGFAFAAPLVAKLLGVRVVHHTIGVATAPSVLELCADALSPVWRSLGLDVPPFGGIYSGITLAVCPDVINRPYPPVAADVRPLRPTPLPLATATAKLPESLRDLTGPSVTTGAPTAAGRPVVYVTLGTFSNTDSAIFRAALDGLADEPVDVVVTVGSNNDPAALDPVPTNARVERFVAQATLLPHCAAVVHHAGSGTMFGALAHGLPQVAIPQGADNFVNAEVLEESGAGIRLLPDTVDAATLRAGVRSILDGDTHAAAARRIAGDIAAMPSAAQVAAELST